MTFLALSLYHKLSALETGDHFSREQRVFIDELAWYAHLRHDEAIPSTSIPSVDIYRGVFAIMRPWEDF